MLDNELNHLRQTALPAIQAADAAALEELRVALMGKTGSVTALLKSLGGMEPEARKALGAEINLLKTEITEALNARKAVLDATPRPSRPNWPPSDLST